MCYNVNIKHFISKNSSGITVSDSILCQKDIYKRNLNAFNLLIMQKGFHISDEAVERAITECIQEGILADFLSRNRSEAKKVSIYEYDEQKHMEFVREEGREEGYSVGVNDMLLLIQKMILNGESDKIRNLYDDERLRMEMFEKYGVMKESK